jgi:hypothetical protein
MWSGWLLAIIAFSGVRDPDVEQPIAWGVPSIAITIQEDGSDDVAGASDLLAVQAAMDVWTRVPCSDFTFSLAGTTPSRADGADGVNLVTFLESGWPPEADGAVAFTLRFRDTASAPDVWTEADVLLNGTQFSWSTSGHVQRFDVQSVVTHELGHALGLQHASLPEATMYFGTRAGVTYARTLHEDDAAGLCWLYPASPFTCSSDAECPLLFGLYGGDDLRFRCEASACVIGASAAYGAECSTASDCAGQCAADPERTSGQDPDFCTMACTAPADCGGDLCANNACWIGRDDCLGDDDCPGVNNVCVFDLDGRFRCRSLCLEDRQCADPSHVCHGGTGANPPGFCRPPGTSSAGASCESGLDCDSLACTGGGATPSCEGPPLARTDAGTPLDAASMDAVPLDAAPPDAGEPDAMAQDAASEGADGGELTDATATDRDLIGSKVEGGCGCSGISSVSGRPPFFFLLFFLIVFLWRPSFL